MQRDLVAGVDSSTQSCTVVLRRLEDGAVVAEARKPHPPTTPPRSEQAPEAWWQALVSAFGELTTYLPRIAGISVGGQGHGLVMLGEDGLPLRDAKLWNDTESAHDASILREMLPQKDWATRTGSVPAAALTVSKLAWTERTHPGMVAKARRIMLPSDYLLYRLSGRATTERGVSSGTGYFNPFTNSWDFALADLAVPNIDWETVLPEIIGSSEGSGPVQRIDGLEALQGAVVGAGSGDNMTAALGMGIREGDVIISFGTSGTLYGRTTVGIKDATGSINGYADAADAFLPMITTLNSAKVTDAFRRILRATTEEFDTLALATEPGARGLVLVPYLDGERTPNLPDATGILAGIRSDVEPGQIARAAVEGVICGLLEGGDYLASLGVERDGRLIVTGGASRSKAYRQILADLTGKQVWTCDLPEAAAAGAAVQAAAAVTGGHTSEITEKWEPRYEVVAEPRERDAARMEEVRGAYRSALPLAEWRKE
ncbi:MULTISPECIES: xylulokinase [unclassified Rhizobium]|uniref:xylulokinase n=1 Tax=unclassified Rhizobium TaxID=2613769 RepID=UPI001ADAEB75|nr:MULTISPECIES: xylulokinase [unclassified Rhizobium]MBO9124941.1 xylulokinase [Rhizobium sp. 16-488-2b]MBO9175526.1 xylulokinase [Rhizobium sp. 16-488-2a]